MTGPAWQAQAGFALLDLASGMRYHRRAFPAFGLLPLRQVVSPSVLLRHCCLKAASRHIPGGIGGIEPCFGHVLDR